MFPWSDAVVVLGLVALAIVGGALGVLPQKLVIALITSAVGYVGARAVLVKRAAKAPGASESGKSEGAVPENRGQEHSGRIEIEPPKPGRIVKVNSDGSVHIGPDSEPSPDPEEGTKPLSADDSIPEIEPDEEK